MFSDESHFCLHENCASQYCNTGGAVLFVRSLGYLEAVRTFDPETAGACQKAYAGGVLGGLKSLPEIMSVRVGAEEKRRKDNRTC